MRGRYYDYTPTYFDADGNIWAVNVDTLAITPAYTTIGPTSTCSAGTVYNLCAGAVYPAGQGGRRLAPRVTFSAGAVVRVRKDTATAPGGDCSSACDVLVSDTTVVTTPTLAATAPLHPVITD